MVQLLPAIPKGAARGRLCPEARGPSGAQRTRPEAPGTFCAPLAPGAREAGGGSGRGPGARGSASPLPCRGRGSWESGARPAPVPARGRARLRVPARRRLHFYPRAAKNRRRTPSRARNSGSQIRPGDSALPGSGRGGSGGRGEEGGRMGSGDGAGLSRAPSRLGAFALPPTATPSRSHRLSPAGPLPSPVPATHTPFPTSWPPPSIPNPE